MGKNKKKRSQQRRQRQQQRISQALLLPAERQQQLLPAERQEQEFNSLFNEGIYLWVGEGGQKRQGAAEKFLEAVDSAQSVWKMGRFFAFVVVMDGALEREQDSGLISTTTDFLYDEEEPAHFRAYAAFSSARRCCLGSNKNKNMNGTAEFCRHGLEIIVNRSSQEDDDRKVLRAEEAWRITQFKHLVSPGNEDGITLKIILEWVRKQLVFLLITTERGGPGHFLAETDDRPTDIDGKRTLLMERYCAGGKMCDCCGKTLEELGLSFWQICRRCEMVNYCSKKCYKEHWRNGGHKDACRKPGEIKVGDDMVLLPDDKEVSFVTGGKFVKVIALVEGETNRWQVKDYELSEIHSVDGDDLIRLRPPPKPKS